MSEVLPVAVEDGYARGEDGVPAAVGQPFSVNVLANDFLGDPPATIVASSFDPAGGCSGFSFDRETGVFSGTPTTPFAFCGFTYVLVNSAGRSQAAAFVEVLPLAGPDAFFDTEQATAGEPFSFNVLTDDDLGHPPATITSNTFTAAGGCSGLSFDPATGVLSGTPIVGTCEFDYAIANVVGSDDAGVSLTFFAGPTAPVAADNTREVTAGQLLFLGVLGNDFLGHPQATITSHTFDAAAAGCGWLSFNPEIGQVFGTAPDVPLECTFEYTISNSAGSSTAQVQIVDVTPPTTTSSTTTTTPPTTSSSTTTSTSSTTTSSTTTTSTTTTTTTVNQDPTAEIDGAEMSKTDSSVVGNVLANDDDPDGDALVVTTAGTFTLTYGDLVLNADGAFTYTLDQSNPDVVILGPDEALTDFFPYEISDGRGGTSAAFLLIVING